MLEIIHFDNSIYLVMNKDLWPKTHELLLKVALLSKVVFEEKHIGGCVDTVKYLQENNLKYKNVHFMGLDFIAKTADAKEFFLGEMNMHCPALISMLGNNFDDACDINKYFISNLF